MGQVARLEVRSGRVAEGQNGVDLTLIALMKISADGIKLHLLWAKPIYLPLAAC